MRKGLQLLLLVWSTLLGVVTNSAAYAADSAGRVVLLHGLARSASSMTKMQKALESGRYAVCNIEYPSRDYPIEILADDFVAPAIAKCFDDKEPIHFVTHSLGGILVRQLAAVDAIPNIGRVVMLSPPNHGSEVVDKLGDLKLFGWVNGPAGNELSTDAEAIPTRLGPVTFELGIITGARSINPFLSMLIPGKDDGKVSIDNAKLEGMRDFIVLRCSHPFIMKSDRAIAQTLYFLNHGAFLRTAADGSNAGLPEAYPNDCWD